MIERGINMNNKTDILSFWDIYPENVKKAIDLCEDALKRSGYTSDDIDKWHNRVKENALISKWHITKPIIEAYLEETKEMLENKGYKNVNYNIKFDEPHLYIHGNEYHIGDNFPSLSFNKESNEELTLIYFDYSKDLSKCIDPLLYDQDDDDVFAEIHFVDKYDNQISLQLIVQGDINIWFDGKQYTSPSEYPYELCELIKSGVANNIITRKDEYDTEGLELDVIDSNWFDVYCSICYASGKKIAEGSLSFDFPDHKFGLNTMTADEIKAILTKQAYEIYYAKEDKIKKEVNEKKSFDDYEKT